jgi:glucans biosynthesis protein
MLPNDSNNLLQLRSSNWSVRPTWILLFSLFLSSAFGFGFSSAEAQEKQQPVAASAKKKPQLPAVEFSNVIEEARALAEKSYKDEFKRVSGLEKITYDEYRMIRFKPERALWKDKSLFQAQFFHLGFLFLRPVQIFEVEKGKSKEVVFKPELFEIADAVKNKIPKGGVSNFAGVKLTYPLHSAAVQDDLAVFLGASYFRLVGRGDQFGMSARGLALNTGAPEGEEFPHFSKFWLVQPSERQTSMKMYALLESENVAGAYQFIIHPGAATKVDVTAQLFFRSTDKKLGIAPLTTMFLRSEGQRRGIDDFRPEVHDSDGLIIHTGSGGERLFRPLANPRQGVRISRFVDSNPKGFGLVQRDREYGNYLDLETYFEARPNFWIEPKGTWGAGSVELVEISTEFETNDNIVAYWVPDAQPEKEMRFEYTVHAGRAIPSPAEAIAFRSVSKSLMTAEQIEEEGQDKRRFVVDFKGPSLDLLAESQPVHAELTMTNGNFSELTVQKNRRNNEWRVTFVATKKTGAASDIRLGLSLYGERLSEVWLNLWDDRL